METCGTCKHRGESIQRWDDDAEDMIDSGFFPCQRIKHDSRYDYPKASGAVVTDGSGYFGQLCVESDFGCVKHEPKA